MVYYMQTPANTMRIAASSKLETICQDIETQLATLTRSESETSRSSKQDLERMREVVDAVKRKMGDVDTEARAARDEAERLGY